MTDIEQENFSKKNQSYSALKYTLEIADTAYLVLLLFLFQGLGLSKFLARGLSKAIVNHYFVISAYIAIVYLTYYVLDFPLNFYQSFVLEHKFSLSQQKIKDWLQDQFKAGIISYIIALILVYALYYILKRFLRSWWWVISLFWIFFSLILAKLLPIVIIPLFFKYRKLSDPALRERILGLAEKMRVKILDVFEIDFSKKTLKANAAFVGIGRSRRVILADTLKDKYSYDEIEVILAHEFAHYKLRHLLKLILLNSFLTIVIFYFIYLTSDYVLRLFGLSSLFDIAALPIIFLYFIIFGLIMQPFSNYISRRLEKDADLLALKATNKKAAFVSMMDKLAGQNLADRAPHPLIKFFFFDHPSIDERIKMAKSL